VVEFGALSTRRRCYNYNDNKGLESAACHELLDERRAVYNETDGTFVVKYKRICGTQISEVGGLFPDG